MGRKGNDGSRGANRILFGENLRNHRIHSLTLHLEKLRHKEGLGLRGGGGRVSTQDAVFQTAPLPTMPFILHLPTPRHLANAYPFGNPSAITGAPGKPSSTSPAPRVQALFSPNSLSVCFFPRPLSCPNMRPCHLHSINT